MPISSPRISITRARFGQGEREFRLWRIFARPAACERAPRRLWRRMRTRIQSAARFGRENGNFAQSANIPTPCALKASFQIFGWGMRTRAFASPGISPTVNIFARGSCERALIALLAKCEPESKARCALGGEMSGWVTKTKKDTHLSVLRFGDPSGNRTRVSSVRG